MRYVSVIVDVGVLSLHIFVYSTFFSELAVAVTASIYIYFILLFLSVLRYDRKLVIFATVFVIFCFNLNYYLRIDNIDPELISQVVSADKAGHFYKSMYIALFGLMLLHIPRLVSELISRQERVLADKKESEIKLAVEKMEKQFLGDRLEFEKEANTELAGQKKQIEAQNEELQQLLATREKLQSVISHDLRNPFTVIQSLTESLNKNLDNMEGQDARRAVQTIHDTNKRGLYLLDNLLNWTRLQTGKLKVDGTSIPVYAVVQNIMEYFETPCNDKNVKILNEVQPSLSLYCDDDMFRTMFRNIVSNALKFTPEGGSVRVYGKTNDGTTTLCIEDNGVGISGNNLKRLLRFDESFSTPGTENEKGSGLGFSLIKEFVDMNRGTFTVLSEEGKGTEVCLTFPESPPG
ncbi:MAG: HAMP domain-containing histidine kinase, partial [Bacteroidales bacterium]|nr:HAMP domain-containing histidine kinase [Bacteroidales bacterium]